MRQVWATAQIGKITVGVEADRTIFECTDQLHFIFITLFRIGIERFSLRNLTTCNRLFGSGQLLHFLLDLGQVRLCDGYRRVHIIIESILNAGTDTEFDPRIECFKRFSQQV